MRSLRARLTLWFALAVTLTAGTAATVGYLLVRQQMLAGIDFLLDAEGQEIVARLGESPLELDPTSIHELLTDHTEIDAPQYFFEVHREGHGEIFRSANLGEFSLPNSSGAATSESFDLNGARLRLYNRHFHDYVVQVATSLDQYDALMARYRRTLLLGAPILLIASTAAGFGLATLALGPIRAMQKSARRISASNLSERLPVHPAGDEIADLARLLNDLFARIEASFEQIKRFTADASHELKTPLSLIRLHAERLQQSPDLPASARSEIEGQLEEIGRLNKLIGNLLLLARADAGSLQLNRVNQPTAAFIRDFSDVAAVLAEDREVRFEVEQNDELQAPFDAALLRQVLLNLLVNAIRHTPAGRSISIRSHDADGNWNIELEDEGPGVPQQDLERVFERFVRHAQGSESTASGSGLGLSIARSIIEAHGGRIRAENRPAGGLRVRATLPDCKSFASR